MFEIIDIIRQYCIDNDYHFLSGQNFNQNYEASQLEYDNGQIVVSADFPFMNSDFLNGQVMNQSFRGALAVGRKFDDDSTPSSLDETFIQKYDRRLKDLKELFFVILADLECDNDATISNIQFIYELNKYDTNIDFVAGNFTISKL